MAVGADPTTRCRTDRALPPHGSDVADAKQRFLRPSELVSPPVVGHLLLRLHRPRPSSDARAPQRLLVLSWAASRAEHSKGRSHAVHHSCSSTWSAAADADAEADAGWMAAALLTDDQRMVGRAAALVPLA